MLNLLLSSHQKGFELKVKDITLSPYSSQKYFGRQKREGEGGERELAGVQERENENLL